jgi:hypothetical protein
LPLTGDLAARGEPVPLLERRVVRREIVSRRLSTGTTGMNHVKIVDS